MFPYLEQPAIRIGPVAIQGFGVLVATGIVVGYFLAIRRMKATRLDAAAGSAMAMWMVVAGLAGSHLMALAQSRPAELYGGPSAVFRIWEGMSSFGGIAAGAAAGACFLARRRLSLRQMRAYFDAVAFAFPVAWMFGRAGCAIAHDHPGVRTNSILAVRYPDGPRFDAGLLEFLATALIASFFVVLRKRALPAGFYLAAFLVLYGPLRFLIETVRTGETTYLGLTAGQYGAAAATLVGIAMEGPALWRKMAPRGPAPRAPERGRAANRAENRKLEIRASRPLHNTVEENDGAAARIHG